MDDTIDQPRQNLLTVVLDRLHQTGKETIVARMMYFSALKHNVNSKEELKSYHEVRPPRGRGPDEEGEFPSPLLSPWLIPFLPLSPPNPYLLLPPGRRC